MKNERYRFRASNIKAALETGERDLVSVAAKALHIREQDILSASLSRRAIDARDKGDVRLVLSIDLETAIHINAPRGVQLVELRDETAKLPSRPPRGLAKRPLVVGLGPAGLFAALTLSRLGLEPLVIERGCDVDARAARVAVFQKGGPLDENTNVQFGEGGAGAFSDGKLNTGISDPRCQTVLRDFYEAGAPESILYAAKPHIGTDRLPGAVRNLREKIRLLGGEVRFETKLLDIRVENGRVSGAVLETPGGLEEIETSDIVLAIGHSARDTIAKLYERGVPMERKPFSIGARIEHPQSMVDISQYGRFAGHKALGAADYKLNVRLPNGRSAYTFCMCPGGTVVAASSEAGGVVTNGMSVYARDGQNANAALLVGVNPEDFGEGDALAGVRFQRTWERAAFLLAGESYKAPAQLVGDFLAGRAFVGAGDVSPSYPRGVVWSDIRMCLPEYVAQTIALSIPRMDSMLRGFARPDAVLTGVETRSSSPVRIPRGADFSSAVQGLYPCGEGAGYAGGILSAAVDGMRCAEALAGLPTQKEGKRE